jgi:tripartite ATP-independent transporter DctM subunit
MINLILFGSFFLLLIINVPIAYCLGLSSVFALMYAHISLSVIATNIYTGMAKFLLLAIPFFVLGGNIMAKAGISDRLIEFADACVGHKRGGFAVVTVIVACFFGAVSGSGPATVAALGAILLPAMIDRDGFSPEFSAGLLATSSSIAIVIPPSIAFIVYSSIVGTSVGDLFMAGIIPGILMGVALVVIAKIEARKHGILAKRKKATGKEIWKSFIRALWAFLMPVIILGGIYGGIFTPTEAAAVSAVYGLIVGLFIYRTVKLKDLFQILVDSGKTTGGIMLIIASASLFSYVCSTQGISRAAQSLLLNVSANKYVFLIIINIIFLIAGCFVDANSAMYIFIPIMYPVAQQLGINLVHFGIIATVNLAIGQVTPPVGVNLFVASGLDIPGHNRVTVAEMSKKVWGMVGACIIVLLIVTYIPKLSLFIIGQ